MASGWDCRWGRRRRLPTPTGLAAIWPYDCHKKEVMGNTGGKHPPRSSAICPRPTGIR